ncbi:hypothetical protein N9948_01795 [bacterium]|nr:hypothetical protein [bacterium]
MDFRNLKYVFIGAISYTLITALSYYLVISEGHPLVLEMTEFLNKDNMFDIIIAPIMLFAVLLLILSVVGIFVVIFMFMGMWISAAIEALRERFYL